jgi:ubiquinone/menaquinone biosynthesis C-methylase UbiE
MKTFLKQVVPGPVKYMLNIPRRLFRHTTYDSSSYWRGRAAMVGQAAVLWTNQDYNTLYRSRQADIVAPHVRRLSDGARVLDIGCGIGVVAKMMLDLNPGIVVDAVDFPEMLQAGSENLDHEHIVAIAGSAEEFWRDAPTYDLIVSSACYSAIRNIASLEKALANGAAMLKVGGTMLMIDPFHRWAYLARAKYGSKDVERFMRARGLQLIQKSGVLFWPFREWLANSIMATAKLAEWFHFGERILHKLGTHFWADYKVLVFKKVA